MLESSQMTGFSGLDLTPAETDYFKTTWTTTVINTVIEIGFGTSNEYAFIDWGDGSVETTRASGAAVTHNYSAAGDYTVKIIGAIHITTDYSANNDMASAICTGVTQMGTGVSYRSMKNMFKSVGSLPFTFTDAPDLSLVTDMTGMFYSLSTFNHNISGWDVSNVTNFSQIFGFNAAFNQDLSSWDVSSATNLAYMFWGCTIFNNGGSSLISTWDVSNVTSMQGMFQAAKAFNQNISGWTTTALLTSSHMFRDATIFNQAIGSWDVSKVTDMNFMLKGAAGFNQSLSTWNVANVTNMSNMFNGATVFNQDISSWDVQLVTNMTNILSGTATSTANYNLMWIAWDALTTLVSSVSFGATGIAATGTGLTARNNIVTNYSWTITDAS